MRPAILQTKNVVVTALAIATTCAVAPVILRVRRAWQNKNIIESADENSIFTPVD